MLPKTNTGETDGGPAFPRSASVFDDRGMRLRDYFAAQALTGFLADGSQRLIAQALEEDPNRHLIQDATAKAAVVNEQLALGCYALADAMLAARKATGGAS